MLNSLGKYAGLAKAAITIGLTSVIVGICQMGVDLSIAKSFGTGTQVDGFFLAFVIPSTLVNVLAGGAIVGAFSPTYIRVANDWGSVAAAQLVAYGAVLLVIWLGLICAALLLGNAYFNWFGRLASSSEAIRVASNLYPFAVLFLFFNGLATFFCAVLVARLRYLSGTLLPAVVPAVALATVVTFSQSAIGIRALAYGYLLGALLLCVVLITMFVSKSLMQPYRKGAATAAIRGLVGDYAWMIGAAALLTGISVTDQLLASSLGVGALAGLNYGTRLINFGVAFLTMIVGNATLPVFSRMVIDRQWSTIWKRLRMPLLCAFCGVSVMVSIIHFLAHPIIELVYERGAFVASDSKSVASIFSAYILHVPFYLVGVVGWRLLNSLRRNDLLLVVALACFSLNAVLDVFLSRSMGVVGIAYSKLPVYAFWALMVVALARNTLVASVARGRASVQSAPAASTDGGNQNDRK